MAKDLVNETKYFKAYYEADIRLLTIEYLAATEEMEDEEFKEQMDIISKIVIEYKPRLGISEMTNFFYTVDPDIQEEIDRKNGKIFIENGLEKLVAVVERAEEEFDEEDPSFDFERMALEQIAEEDNHNDMQAKVFSSEKEARKWLLS